MAKLNKYANIYDKDGNLVRHVDPKTGKLEDYTLEELEELVDKLGEDKDENGKLKDPQAFNNASMLLMQYYQKYGNPHLAEILEKMKQNKPKVTSEKDTIESLNELAEQLKEDVTKEAIEESGESPNSISETDESMSGNMEDVKEDVEAQTDNELEANASTDINLDEEYIEYEDVEQ